MLLGWHDDSDASAATAVQEWLELKLLQFKRNILINIFIETFCYKVNSRIRIRNCVTVNVCSLWSIFNLKFDKISLFS